jgi:uncharacterized membrane protein required for colicin V production
MSPYLIFDALILGALSFFALRGLKKGLVMSVASVLILVISLLGANYAVKTFSPLAEVIIEPMVSGWVDTNAGNIIADAVPDIGFGIADAIANQAKKALTSTLAATIAKAFTFIAAFLVITLLLSFAAKLLNIIAKLPILNTLNKLGGVAGGLIQGTIIVWMAVFIFSATNVITEDIASGTVLLKFFMRFV